MTDDEILEEEKALLLQQFSGEENIADDNGE
jgi:hypothetical protein